MRLHVLAVPHTITSQEYSGCAFTQKVLKFCKMMTLRGHHVMHYGHEKSVVECAEKITVMTDEVLERCYGNYDWRLEGFKHQANDAAHMFFNLRAAEEVASRKQRGDYLLLFWGLGHAHVAKCHPDMIVIEPGIGSFNNVLAPYSVFESYAVMHHVYGKYGHMPRLFDAVIPNYFDVSDFIDTTTPQSLCEGLKLKTAEVCGLADKKAAEELRAKAKDLAKEPAKEPAKSDQTQKLVEDLAKEPAKADQTGLKRLICEHPYALFIGRIIASKGLQLAITACHAAGLKLLIAGQGKLEAALEATFKYSATCLEDPIGVTQLGYIEPCERAILIAKARCVLSPTLYAEPFGGVNVEAQMSGVPVVTTDFGGFSETVLHGVSGYRCRSLEQFVWALQNVQHLDRMAIRSWAIGNYGFTKVGSMYEEYFAMIRDHIYGNGPKRLGLKWLEKTIP